MILEARIKHTALSLPYGREDRRQAYVRLLDMCWAWSWAPLGIPKQESQRCRIAVRKRPLWEREEMRGEFHSLTIQRRQCVLHDARLNREHRTFIYHREFSFGEVHF